MKPQRSSSAWPLAWVWIALIVYASLHPFSGWRWMGMLDGPALLALAKLPLVRGFSRFDIVTNLLAYIPLGGLLALGALRDGRRPWRAMLLATLSGSLLSYAMEVTQHLLPMRYPSLIDWVSNTLGTLAGALMAGIGYRIGLLRWWQHQRDHWFVPHGTTGIVLLLSWPVALLFPPPLPLGLGQGLGRLAEALAGVLADTAFDGWVPLPDVAAQLAPGGALCVVALGALAPCFVGYAMVRSPFHRLVLLAGGLLLGVGATTLSTALNFGPEHAMAWISAPVLPGLGLAALLGLALAWLPHRFIAALGLMALTILVALINQAGSTPYTTLSLQGWEQGRFIRFHGLAQWVGWLWPFAALLFLLARSTERRNSPR
ncbi:MAG: VanZ family protein [Burkholderiales bacterium]